ncbi:MAG: ester cyclase [Bacteroidia bacterium]|nr:ester cyclase [Bacteroidia bacterium]
MKTTRLFSLALLSFAFLFVSCGQSGPDPKIAKNKEAINKVFEAFNTGNLEGIENYVDENFVEHTPDPNIKTTGLAGLKETITTYRTSFPDLKMTALSTVSEGDLVVIHFNMKGTNTGPMGEMPPTNKAIDVDGVDIVKMVNGKGTEHWGYVDQMKFMMQLGMMHDPAGMPLDSAAVVQ